MYKFQGFTEKANLAINYGIETAEKMCCTWIGSEHILLGLLKEGSGVAYTALSEEGVEFDQIYDLLKDKFGEGNSRVQLTIEDFTPRVKNVIQKANILRARLHNSYIGTEHLLLAILDDEDSFAVGMLNELGVNIENLTKKIAENISTGNGRNDGFSTSDSKFGSKSSGNKGSTKTLEQFGRDLTALAKEGGIDPVIGREKEIERVIQIL